MHTWLILTTFSFFLFCHSKSAFPGSFPPANVFPSVFIGSWRFCGEHHLPRGMRVAASARWSPPDFRTHVDDGVYWFVGSFWTLLAMLWDVSSAFQRLWWDPSNKVEPFCTCSRGRMFSI
uniref:(northern house mosquito) hypothetical protein n=1 Tax=Culex pipiens TaxID=7175 RepID=A0A8D8CXX5_CULPI